MKKQQMSINIKVINALLTQGKRYIIRDILDIAADTVKSGGTVTIQHEYINGKPSIIKVLESLEDVHTWRDSL